MSAIGQVKGSYCDDCPLCKALYGQVGLFEWFLMMALGPKLSLHQTFKGQMCVSMTASACSRMCVCVCVEWVNVICDRHYLPNTGERGLKSALLFWKGNLRAMTLIIANFFNDNLPWCSMNVFCTGRVLFLPALFRPPVRDCQGHRFCIFRRGEFPWKPSQDACCLWQIM